MGDSRERRRQRVAIAAAAIVLGAATACTLPFGLGSEAGAAERDATATTPEPTLLSSPRQLSFVGRRSGEGYYSRDAAQLVFQSEREPGNPFFQIYLMNLHGGDVKRVSTGVGKATCGFVHPGGDRVLYASTHLDPEAPAKQQAEIEARAAGEKKRYSWDYDEHYDLFSASSRSGNAPTQRLTRARGYDAEAAWSPNGREIVFASNRHAYGPDGLVVDEALFATDPAHFVDLYIMDSNGQNVRRLTDHAGYDGGPFFSPGGDRIVWRRFEPGGTTAEIFSMRTDGSDVRQLTRLGAMSWAPFYHPSGDYVVFSTNLHGMNDFELYIVDVEGRSEPVRVTSAAGFDGLPSFSPDGRSLVWTSNRGSADKTSQLFIGAWNDELARRRLGLQSTSSPQQAALLPLPTDPGPSITAEELEQHVAALTNDVTEGRLTGTPGEKIATSYVARSFRQVGLAPAGDNGTYFQEFGFTAGVSLGEGNQLSIFGPAVSDATPLQVDRDWRPYAFSREGETPAAGVVFAGYGIVAPAGESQRAIDSYAGLDVKDRWVLVFRFTPTGLSPESRRHLHRYSSLRHKAMMARDRGARGLLVVSGPASKVREQLAPLRFDVSLAGSSIAVVSVTDTLAETLLAGSAGGLAALQKAVDRDSGYRGFPLEGVEVSANIQLEHQRRKGRNVLGRLVVGDAPSRDFVMLGAHVDHLGRGEGASSLAGTDEKGMIHPGADDNASGVAAMLEAAHALASLSQRGDLDARRDVVFAAWSGEEIGLLGSSHYVAELAPAHSGTSAADQVVAYLNMDMVGRMEESVSLFGVSSSSAWLGLIERENVRSQLAIRVQQDSYLPTDATAFYMREIPILSAFTGAHTEYHTPRDRAELLDYDATRDITRLMADLTRAVAERDERPDYIATKPPAGGASTSGIRVYLGTIPDYAQSDAAGVVLAGVAKGGPAETAGIRGGDMIVQVGERAIENIYDYTYALDELQIDEPTPIVVLRDSRRIEFTVTPDSRQ